MHQHIILYIILRIPVFIFNPFVDGISIATLSSTLKKNPVHQHSKIIVISNTTLDEDPKQTARSGIDFFIKKPFNISTLVSHIYEVLKLEKPEEIQS